MPVPGRADAERDRVGADRVDVALLRHRLRRDLLAAVAPDDVLEDVADVLAPGRARATTASTVFGPDLVAALDQLDELVDDRARLGDLRVVALDRQLVAAQQDACSRSRVAQRVEHAVADPGELRGDLVRRRRASPARVLSVGRPDAAHDAGRAAVDALVDRHEPVGDGARAAQLHRAAARAECERGSRVPARQR